MATTCSAILTNPMEVAKTRLQLSGELNRVAAAPYNGVFDALHKIWAHEGIRGTQAGLLPMIAFQVTMNGTRLGMYPYLEGNMRALAGDSVGAAVGGKLVCGAVAGACGAMLGSPLYLVKCRMQAQSSHFKALEQHAYRGLWHGLRTVTAESGVAGLYHGSRAIVVRVSMGSAVQLTSYDTTKATVQKHFGLADGVPTHILSSLVAGLMVSATTVMSPLDVVSTRIYNQKAGQHYSGILNCLVKTVQAEGIKSLWKGWIAQYMRLGPHTVITFLLWEQFKRIMPF